MDYGPICGLVLQRTTSPPPKLELKVDHIRCYLRQITLTSCFTPGFFLAFGVCQEIRIIVHLGVGFVTEMQSAYLFTNFIYHNTCLREHFNI